jgi:hypothetical protein
MQISYLIIALKSIKQNVWNLLTEETYILSTSYHVVFG